MRLSPIIERELRLASRRGLTYWMRPVAGLVMLLACSPVLLVVVILPRFGLVNGIPAADLGPILFHLLGFVAIIGSVGAGWFFAADAIASERREGTLELLFLAPVRPRDVVLAKLATLLWRASQWLLTVLPIFALSVLAGGVQGQDLIALACITANTLFWSVATSLHASSKSQSVFEALSRALVLQLAFLLLPFLLDLAVDYLTPGTFVSYASVISPAYGWVRFARSSSTPDFWTHLTLLHALAWGVVGLTIHATGKQVRQNPTVRSASPFASLQTRWRYGNAASRAAFRRIMLAMHPIRWLVERERGPARFILLVLVVTVVAITWTWLSVQEVAALLAIGLGALFILGTIITLLFAAQASRFLVEARKSGALELLLVSPVSSREILQGQYRSLLRTFGLPIGVVVLGQLGLGWAQSAQFATATGAMASPAGPLAAIADMQRLQWLSSLLYVLISLLSYVSLAWVGAWMGLACRQASIALFASLAIAKVFPFFAAGVAQASVMPLVLNNRLPAWIAMVTQSLAVVGLHVGLIFLARYQLLPDLRHLVDHPSRIVLPTLRRTTPPRLPAKAGPTG